MQKAASLGSEEIGRVAADKVKRRLNREGAQCAAIKAQAGRIKALP